MQRTVSMDSKEKPWTDYPPLEICRSYIVFAWVLKSLGIGSIEACATIKDACKQCLFMRLKR
jgi:hypothetical protein